jgi:hypothetical protein
VVVAIIKGLGFGVNGLVLNSCRSAWSGVSDERPDTAGTRRTGLRGIWGAGPGGWEGGFQRGLEGARGLSEEGFQKLSI